MSKRFKHLFSPIEIGNVRLRNRIVFPAHLTNLAERGLPSERLSYYYAERAKGGCGLIITEEQTVHPTDRAYEKLIDVFDESVLPGYRLMTNWVHQYGAKIFAQINHNGAQGSSIHTALPVWGPSPIPDPLFREVPKQMDKIEIRQLVSSYARSASLVKEGGFDGLEFQGSHSSILRQFLSPLSNQREDEYGGNPENRFRLVREIAEAVRCEVGSDFVVGIRLSGEEFVDGGLGVPDVVAIAKKVDESGLFDYINTSVGIATHALFMVEGTMAMPPGYSVYMTSAIRRAVNIPVISVGRIKDPTHAEKILQEGHADLVGMVRAQISDPEFANKAFNGQDDSIRMCLSCNQDCIGRVGINRSIGCIQNPAAGNEKKWGVGRNVRTDTPKKVMVIGGGPAGMEAACIAAKRGHRVTLIEQNDELGGQALVAGRLPYRSEFGDVVRNLTNALNDTEVDVRLSRIICAADILREMPDVVIAATGSIFQKPGIEGCDQENVFTLWDILTKKPALGSNLVMIDQIGFHQSTGTAEMLADQGKTVEVISPSLYVGQDLGRTLDLELWYKRVREKGVTLSPNYSLIGIKENTVTAIHNYSGKVRQWDGIDQVVLATPNQANDELYLALKGKIKELYRIGDCLAPRRVDSAIRDGFRVGIQL